MNPLFDLGQRYAPHSISRSLPCLVSHCKTKAPRSADGVNLFLDEMSRVEKTIAGVGSTTTYERGWRSAKSYQLQVV